LFVFFNAAFRTRARPDQWRAAYVETFSRIFSFVASFRYLSTLPFAHERRQYQWRAVPAMAAPRRGGVEETSAVGPALILLCARPFACAGSARPTPVLRLGASRSATQAETRSGPPAIHICA
jgi:hypothetical protein